MEKGDVLLIVLLVIMLIILSLIISNAELMFR